jgi:hypothetical protein
LVNGSHQIRTAISQREHGSRHGALTDTISRLCGGFHMRPCGKERPEFQAAQQALPKSALGQAAAYSLNMWVKLRRCFDYAEVELSNNLAENSMRPVALGRKNWLHVGSAHAGPKVAAILSVVESCRRLGVPVKEYLSTILPGLSRRKLPEVRLLTPSRWAASRSSEELRRLSGL